MANASEPSSPSDKTATATNPAAHGSKHDHFSAVPPELRLMIYDYVIPVSIGEAIQSTDNPFPAILQVSRLIRKEVSQIWIHHTLARITKCTDLLKTLKQLHALADRMALLSDWMNDQAEAQRWDTRYQAVRNRVTALGSETTDVTRIQNLVGDAAKSAGD